METPLSMHATPTADQPGCGVFVRLLRLLHRSLSRRPSGGRRMGSWERLASHRAAQLIAQAKAQPKR